MTDYCMATPGMIADSLRPLVIGHGDGLPPETVTVPLGTLTGAYMHLERMAAYEGEETLGHRVWADYGNPVCRRAAALWDVAKERLRQIEAKGWTPQHDDTHDDGSLAAAAGCYARGSPSAYEPVGNRAVNLWPWHQSWWKPSDRRRNLVKAGALVVAEIERIDRAAAKGENPCRQCDGKGVHKGRNCAACGGHGYIPPAGSAARLALDAENG